jgi:hypothetical protein
LNVLQNNIYDKLQLKERIMSKLKHLFRALLLLLALSATFLFNTTAQAEDNAALDWPGLYDPFTVLNLHLDLVDGDDLDIILNDTTYDIEVPAWFWADGEESHKILVSIRRKSATAIPNELADWENKKVSFKVDINEYYEDDPRAVKTWHGIKKLSLENGDDQDVVTEGFSWYLHRLASNSGLDYQSGLASWINLHIDGKPMGVYVNVEQPDKQYLKNRELWEGGDDTWLYKMSSIDSPEAKEAPEDDSENVIDSPESETLCYKPFKDKGRCDTPSDFKDQLNSNINMEGMLTLGAVSAFHYSPDDLFSKGKNFYYTDASGRKREYMQWDLDSAFGSMDPNTNMYNQATKGRHDVYEKSLVEAGDAPFREEYNDVIKYLLDDDGPFDESKLLADLKAFEILLGPSLELDPNSKDAADSFSTLAAYVTARIASMRGQLPAGPPLPPGPDDIHVGDLDGSATSGANRTWSAEVTVTIHDYEHVGNVDGATVSASWSGGVAGETSCETDTNGQCSLTADVTKKNLKKVSLTITDVILGGSNYVFSANHDVDGGDSDGTSITISRP